MIRLQAAKVLNSHAQVWNMLGRCQVSSGDVTDGICSYQRSLRIQDGSREAWFNLAQANKEVGLLCWAGGGLQKSCAHVCSAFSLAAAAAALVLLLPHGSGGSSGVPCVLTYCSS